jgi:hypothetical protein
VRNSPFIIPRIFVLLTCMLMLLLSQNMAADKKVFGEMGPGFALASYGEFGENSLGLMLSIALMGSHFGVEGNALFHGVFRSTSFAGSFVFSTEASAPVSAFAQIGVGTNEVAGFLLPAGIGVKLKVCPDFFLSARLLVWITYEGGYSLDFGFRLRLR